MKRILIVVIVLAMVVGCAGVGKWSPGAQTVVDFMCQPTAAQQEEAAKWLTAMDNIQAGVSTAFPAASIVKASSAMKVLAKGDCFVLAEVEAALVLLADMQSKQAAVKGMMKAAAATSEAQYPALWAAVKGK
jgi:hypothetical protein